MARWKSSAVLPYLPAQSTKTLAGFQFSHTPFIPPCPPSLKASLDSCAGLPCLTQISGLWGSQTVFYDTINTVILCHCFIRSRITWTIRLYYSARYGKDSLWQFISCFLYTIWSHMRRRNPNWEHSFMNWFLEKSVEHSCQWAFIMKLESLLLSSFGRWFWFLQIMKLR